MAQKRAITEAITSLAEAESRFNLRRTEDEQFFLEWSEDLPSFDLCKLNIALCFE